ncbi:MAG: hypothetical protein LBU65_04295 [Planctomycetaceae bacterium]|nr:hypothetical protein [Planctomycetaceae bacterium]
MPFGYSCEQRVLFALYKPTQQEINTRNSPLTTRSRSSVFGIITIRFPAARKAFQEAEGDTVFSASSGLTAACLLGHLVGELVL